MPTVFNMCGVMMDNKRAIRIKSKTLVELLATVAAFAVLCIAIPNFASFSNIVGIIKQSCYVMIPAVPLTLVIVTGGIDLSIGGMMSMAGVISAILVNAGVPIGLVLIGMVVLGALLGISSGFMIAKMGFPAFICTYTLGQIFGGIALLLCDGKSVRIDNEQFLKLGNTTFLNIPIVIYIALFLTVCGVIVAEKTALGNRIYAMGGNATVIRQEGISISRLHMFIYGFSGLYAAIAGILLSARLGAASPVQGKDYMLNCVAACILGGVNMAGGSGKIRNTALGAIVIVGLRNILNLLEINPNIQNVFLGLVIICMVTVSIFTKQRAAQALQRY